MDQRKPGLGRAGRGTARHGTAGHGEARPGRARQGEARQGNYMTIYIITDGKFHKIGFTNGSVQKRLKQLQTGNPNKLEVVGVLPEADENDEEKLKRLYACKRCSGGTEWFDLSPDDIELVLTRSKDNEYDGRYGRYYIENCNPEGPKGIDVRPLSWGQQNAVAGGRKNVLLARNEEALHSSAEFDVLFIVNKQHFSPKTY